MDDNVIKWVVLTGATGGIGRALVPRLRGLGFGVLAIGRSAAALNELSQHDRAIQPITCDLTNPLEVEAIAIHLSETFDLVGLINNAAIQCDVELSTQSPSDIDTEIRTNLTAPAILAARLCPMLPSKSGFIVNVTSGLAIAPKSSAAVYCATKAGLANLTIGIANQLAPNADIAIIDVVLPLVDTPMTRGRGTGKLTADQASEAIIKAIKARRPIAFVGKSGFLSILSRLSPNLANKIMRRM